MACVGFLRSLLDDIPLVLTACLVALLQGNNGYDIIIVDSSDPVGPAETLFQPTFYQVRDACRRKETYRNEKKTHAGRSNALYNMRENYMRMVDTQCEAYGDPCFASLAMCVMCLAFLSDHSIFLYFDPTCMRCDRCVCARRVVFPLDLLPFLHLSHLEHEEGSVAPRCHRNARRMSVAALAAHHHGSACMR